MLGGFKCPASPISLWLGFYNSVSVQKSLKVDEDTLCCLGCHGWRTKLGVLKTGAGWGTGVHVQPQLPWCAKPLQAPAPSPRFLSSGITALVLCCSRISVAAPWLSTALNSIVLLCCEHHPWRLFLEPTSFFWRQLLPYIKFPSAQATDGFLVLPL